MGRFKQFLVEGGAATAKAGTVRATAADITRALKVVSDATGISEKDLKDNLLGSTTHTLNGLKADSGDIDIAVLDTGREKVNADMMQATGSEPRITGGSVYSYAVPVGEKRKVQVDLMFVPDLAWARFAFHSPSDSRYNGSVRNELLHSALKFSMEKDKDVRVKSDDGHDLARASRSYKLDTGVERIFRVAKPRKDGKGFTQGLEKVSPEEVKKRLADLGHGAKFSPEADVIRDPAVFGALLFGSGTKVKDLMTTEGLIRLIKKRADHADIFKDAVKAIKRKDLTVPEELASYA